MSERDQLLDDLCRAPDDWKLRGVLGDWFEDNNHSGEAACLRWMVEHKKRPYHSDSSPQVSWFNADTISSGLGDPESDVPGPVYEQLAGGKVTANHKTYDGLRAAEEAFLAAFLKAVKKGWKPPKAAASSTAAKPKASRKKAEKPAEPPAAEPEATPKKGRKKGK
jgi:hypothetical protein